MRSYSTSNPLRGGLAAALGMLSIAAVHAQDIFNGAYDSDWATSSNWSNGTPGSGADVAFNTGVLSYDDTSVSLNSLTFDLSSADYVDIEANNYGSSITLSLTGPGILSFGYIYVEGGGAQSSNNVITNSNAASLNFYGSSSSGDAEILNVDGFASTQSPFGAAFGGGTIFTANSSAGSSYILNEGALDPSAFGLSGSPWMTGSGTTQFNGASSASGAEIVNQAGASGSGTPGQTYFFGYATAGSASIINDGASGLVSYHAFGGTTVFGGNSTAGSSILYNDGGDGNVGGGAGGGNTTFAGNSSAGSALLISYGGSNGGNSGAFYFTGNATGGNATLDGSGGLFDISGDSGSVSVGAIEGTGNIDLGGQNLTVGSLNTNTTYSGVISDGGVSGGTGGSLTKVGTGTLTLGGANIYTGNTIIDFGTLAVTGAGASIESPNANGISVGYNLGDTGTLLVSNGGAVASAYGYLGMEGSGSAMVTGVNANGTASTWDNSQILLVGYSGNGTLNIQNGGEVEDLSGYLGNAPSSTGIVTVTGINANGTLSTWSNSYSLLVGDSGGTGTLSIQDGGKVTDTYGYIGYSDFEDGDGVVASKGMVTVAGINANGTASIWSNSSSLTVGFGGGTGTLNIQNGGVVQIGGGIGTLNLISGILNIGDGALSGTLQAADVTGFSGAAQVVFAETDASYTFATNLMGSLSVTQSGSGTTILTGTNNYTGGTTVSAGTLAVNGSVTGNVSVNSGGTLGGGGTIGGKVTVASGGSTYPGDPQILTAGSAEYQDGSTAQFAIATTNGSSHPPTPGVDYDQIKLTSDAPQSLLIDPGTTTLQLNLTATSLAALQSNASDHINDLYFVFNLGSGTSSGGFSDLTLTEGTNTYTDAITNGTATFAQLGLDFNLSYTASELNNSLSGGNDVAFGVTEAVPEPSTWAILLGGMGLLAFWRGGARHGFDWQTENQKEHV